MTVGVVDDIVKQNTLAVAKAKFDLLRLIGIRAVRISEIWAPGLQAPTAEQQRILGNVTGAAQLAGVEVYASAYNATFTTTPLSDRDQSDFAAYTAALVRNNPSITHVIVGNEPNLNRFWMPQFGPGGADVAAPAYESLLARTYDAVKAVDPQITIIGVAVSPRGVDKPNTGRDTHSPVTFLTDIGAAYRASGRTLPIMDMLSIHVYEDNSSLPPTFPHPNPANHTISVNDYSKLVSVLSQAFDGTGQPGSTLPIDYGEFGVESQIPADKASLYTGSEIPATESVNEATQGLYYRQALGLSFCEPNVKAFFFLHAVDEPDLDRWQSGFYYADGTPKSDLPAVQQAVRDVRAGVIARCPGLQLTPQAKIAYPSGAALKRVPLTLTVTCDIDCNYFVRLVRLPGKSTTLAAYGRVAAGTAAHIQLPARRVAAGRYQFTVRLTAPVNVGPPLKTASRPFVLTPTFG
jgi:hypothetical protein